MRALNKESVEACKGPWGEKGDGSDIGMMLKEEIEKVCYTRRQMKIRNGCEFLA